MFKKKETRTEKKNDRVERIKERISTIREMIHQLDTQKAYGDITDAEYWCELKKLDDEIRSYESYMSFDDQMGHPMDMLEVLFDGIE